MAAPVRTITLLAPLLLLGGCSYSDIPFAYEVPVQQGNIITDDMVEELRPGMSRREVRFLLGTPAIDDLFRDDRWDYVHTDSPGGGGEPDRLTVYFDGDRLERVEGNLAPEDFGDS